MMACGGGPRRRGEQGLTTLEWLLIVAAVAGLAVVSVVIVTRVVDQTAAQVASANPTVAAAQESTRHLVEQAREFADVDPGSIDDAWLADFRQRCNRLGASYRHAVEVWVIADKGNLRVRNLIWAHSLDLSDHASWSWDHTFRPGLVSVQTWLDGGAAPVLVPFASGADARIGCFVRQRPTG